MAYVVKIPTDKIQVNFAEGTLYLSVVAELVNDSTNLVVASQTFTGNVGKLQTDAKTVLKTQLKLQIKAWKQDVFAQETAKQQLVTLLPELEAEV